MCVLRTDKYYYERCDESPVFEEISAADSRCTPSCTLVPYPFTLRRDRPDRPYPKAARTHPNPQNQCTPSSACGQELLKAFILGIGIFQASRQHGARFGLSTVFENHVKDDSHLGCKDFLHFGLGLRVGLDPVWGVAGLEDTEVGQLDRVVLHHQETLFAGPLNRLFEGRVGGVAVGGPTRHQVQRRGTLMQTGELRNDFEEFRLGRSLGLLDGATGLDGGGFLVVLRGLGHGVDVRSLPRSGDWSLRVFAKKDYEKKHNHAIRVVALFAPCFWRRCWKDDLSVRFRQPPLVLRWRALAVSGNIGAAMTYRTQQH